MDIANRKIYENKQLWDNYGDGEPAETERIAFVLNNIPQDVSSLVDVGCGSGSIINEIEGKFSVGIDGSYQALVHVGTHKLQGHVATLPFKDTSFDLVMCCEVLEHLPESVIKQTVTELQRVSSEYVLVTVSYKENLSLHTLRCPMCQNVFHRNGHVQCFDFQNITQYFTNTEIVKLETFGPVRQRYSERVVLWAQKCGFCFGDTVSVTTVCPECGSKRFHPLGGAEKRIRKYIRKAAGLFVEEHPNWLFLLAKK